MIDEKALFKITFVIMLSISVAEKSVTLVGIFIVDKKKCEKTSKNLSTGQHFRQTLFYT